MSNTYVEEARRPYKQFTKKGEARTHGFCSSGVGELKRIFYGKWDRMKNRCNRKENHNYAYYGGRGIKLEWKSFEEFVQDMYPSFLKHVKKHGLKDTSIDRIDPNGHYSKANCRWATGKIQAVHKRTAKNIPMSACSMYWVERRQKWVLKLRENIILGSFKDKKDARKVLEAFDELRARLGGFRDLKTARNG